MVAKAEMDSVKVVLGEQSLRERERDKRIEELEKQFSWLADPEKSDFVKRSVEHYIAYLKKKEKGN